MTDSFLTTHRMKRETEARVANDNKPIPKNTETDNTSRNRNRNIVCHLCGSFPFAWGCCTVVPWQQKRRARKEPGALLTDCALTVRCNQISQQPGWLGWLVGWRWGFILIENCGMAFSIPCVCEDFGSYDVTYPRSIVQCRLVTLRWGPLASGEMPSSSVDVSLVPV